MIYNDLDKLSKVIEQEKKNWKSIIWTNGCFDIMHPGHMKTFKVCKKLADIVIVWMNGDLSPYWSTKPWRPINNQIFRWEMLDNIKNVDYIYVYNDENPVKPVGVLKPNFILKWWDYIIDSIKKYIKEDNWLLDLTDSYKYMIDKWIEEYVNKKWFMPEWVEIVKNGWKIIIVPILTWFSTTNIINKIK